LNDPDLFYLITVKDINDTIIGLTQSYGSSINHPQKFFF